MKQAMNIVRGVKYREHCARFESRIMTRTNSNITLLYSTSLRLKTPA